MKTRVITGLSAAAVVLGLLFFANFFIIKLVMLACAVLAYLEYDKLVFNDKNIRRQVKNCALICVSITLLPHYSEAGWLIPWLGLSVLAIACVIESNISGKFEESFENLKREWFSYVYIVGTFGFILPILAIHDKGRQLMLLLLLIVFCGDTAAYFVGIKYGKKKLAEKVSPKKSVEGAVAALLTSLLISVAWVGLMDSFDTKAASRLLFFAPVASMLAQFGDLFESVIKRSLSVKDSGNFFPGHGGLLDRVDSLTLVTPIYYFYLSTFVLAA